jgi:hypothetical protein
MMDTLHAVLRSIRASKTREKPVAGAAALDVFREFLGHLDRIGRRGRERDAAKVSARLSSPRQRR